MVLWGGLRPILYHAVVDAISLSCFAWVCLTEPSVQSWTIFGGAAGVAVAASGNLTNRWTVIFFLWPLLLLQTLRLIFRKRNFSYKKEIIRFFNVLSFLLVIMSSVVSVLFPAVELGNFHSFGDYNVGVVDVYLPINLNFRSSIPGTEHVTPNEQDHATIRILYPTHDEPISIPYLRPHTSEEYCEQNMKHSAPPPLRPFSWMIHNWRLVHLPGRHHAKPTIAAAADGRTEDGDGLLPIVFFSHGLGGSAEMYSYQTHALAKNGYLVIVIDHTDGSAPVVPRKDGTMLLRNDTIIQHWLDGDKEYYKLLRQTMTDYRAQELLSVVDSVVKLNKDNLQELDEVGLDFRNYLDTSNIHFVSGSVMNRCAA